MPFDIDPSPLIISIATTFTATIVTFFLGIFAARSMQRVRGSARAWIDGGRRVSIWTGTTRGQLQGQYYWGGRPVAFHKGSAAHFQHQDWLGTERLRTTYNGAVEGTFTSLPFGDDQTTGSGTDGDAYHFAQLDDDTETETGHAQFRQYSTAQGRWQSPDPYSGSYDFSNPQSFDRYVYVQNAPEGFIDPLGLDHLQYSDGCTYYVTSSDVGVTDKDGNYTYDVLEATTLIGCGVEVVLDMAGPIDGIPFVEGGDGGFAPNNGPTVSHCLGAAASAKGVSMGLDILGAIPVFGNGVSAGAGIVRAGIAVDHVITSPAFAVGSGLYGAYGGVTGGPGEATDSLVGSASAGAGIGLALADASLAGTKAIPIVGNFVSVATLGWDGYQAYKTYQSCMAGH